MKRYEFDREIQRALKGFKANLSEQRLEENTVRMYGNYAGVYLSWLTNENIEKSEARYNDIIAFIHSLQETKHSTPFINRILLAVRHYYNYLKMPKNPASGIHLRGGKRTLPNKLVAYDDILSIYDQYQSLDDRTKRNKTMLGLMIYQAVTTEELRKLELHHIKFMEGKIYVPGGKHSNARVLKLEGGQLLGLQGYLMDVRLRMMREIEMNHPGRKPDKVDVRIIDNQLFFSKNGCSEIKNSITHLFRHIKKLNPEISSAKVIRQSVIAHWLKSYGIRQVQYMAGHRHVSSTERYKHYNMEELAEAVHEFHPLN